MTKYGEKLGRMILNDEWEPAHGLTSTIRSVPL